MRGGAPVANVKVSRSKRIQHFLIAACLRMADAVVGGFSPRLRGTVHYLTGLIHESRHGEVDALLVQGTRRILRHAFPVLNARAPVRTTTLTIDAATQMLAPNGNVVSKRCWRYPSTEAPILVSIVIPCFNYGRFVMEAVRSARTQTIYSLEVIVVDDGSTDPQTVEVLDALARNDEVFLLRQVNQGLPTARNAGIAAACGEFVCCLDADDLIDPTYLELAVALLMSDSSIGFAYSYVRFFGDVDEVWETRDFDIHETLIANFTAVSAVFRRDDWREIGGYSPEMRGGFEDWEFWIRLARLGRTGRVMRHPLFMHRRHGRTMTHDAKDMQEELHARIRRLNPEVFSDPGLRRTLRGLAGSRQEAVAAFRTLTPAVAADPRPGLLVVVAWLRRGGAERLLLSILNELAITWRIVIVTTEADSHLMAADFRSVTAEIFHLHETVNACARLAFFSHLLASRRIARVLSSGSAWFLKELPKLQLQAPMAFKTANIIHNEVPDSVFRAAVSAGNALGQHVAVSRKVEDLLCGSGIAPDSVIRIVNGIDPVPLATAAARRNELRARRGLGEDDVLLVWAGRLAVEKRPKIFVRIVGTLRKQMKLHAVLAGDGPLADDVYALIKREDLVDVIATPGHLPGSEVAELLAAADILVLTSAVEGLPLIVLEALAAGCPVAATDVGDISSVVVDGVDGVLVPAATPWELAQRITDALTNGIGRPSNRAAISKRFAAGPHTLGAMTASYARLLRSRSP